MPSQMSPEVLQALQRRSGAPTPQLNQMTPGSAGAPDIPQPMPMSEMTQASAPPQSEPVQQSKFQASNQDDAIVLALIEKMKNNDKLKKEQTQMAPQPAPAPQAPPSPMGGGGQSYHQYNKGGGGFSLSSGYDQPMPVNQMQSNYNGGLGKDYSGLSNYGKGF